MEAAGPPLLWHLHCWLREAALSLLFVLPGRAARGNRQRNSPPEWNHLSLSLSCTADFG
jgi:hypothetical protein